MSVTSCNVDMTFADVTALADATETNNGSILSTNSLFKEKTAVDGYGTMELNQFVLDGEKAIMPDSPTNIAYWSEYHSNADCKFTVDPIFTIAFTTTHTSSGITLTFQDDYPVEILVTWFTVAGTKICAKTFYPDSLVYYCRNQTTLYGKITIEFVKTRNPLSYIKMQYILYGVDLTWGGDLVKTAKVTESIDETMSQIAINTAEVTIIDEDNNFDIGNEDGEWKSVQKQQALVVTETQDGTVIPIGTYFMNKWTFSKNIAKFTLQDAIGIMDSYTFYGGDVYVDVKAGVILDAIFAACNITDYSIGTDVYDILLSGWIANQTCRKALQKVLFACGAVCDDSRTSTVRIYKPDRYIKYTVYPERKFYGKTAVLLDTYVSGVSISYAQYVLNSTIAQIYKGSLVAGDTRINFTQPYLASSITATNCTIKEVHTNYIVVTATEDCDTVISGQGYTATTFTYQKDVNYIDSGEIENVKKFSGNTLCCTSILPTVAKSLLDYFSLRKKLSMQYLAQAEQVGNWISVVDTDSNYSSTLIEKQTIDLTGGFISTATCRGYSAKVKSSNFTGQKLYTGRRIGLL